MGSSDQFLTPRLTVEGADRYVVRSSLLAAVREALPLFRGEVLDVGCGQMPYRPLIEAAPGVSRYRGMDLPDPRYNAAGNAPDLLWDGRSMPLPAGSVDVVMATEVLEHVFEPAPFLAEVHRVLRPAGLFFFTVPFLWPLHDVPHDAYRYTPFALERLLGASGFQDIRMRSLGGWDASLAQLIGLWVRRRPMGETRRLLCSRLALPVMRFLLGRDRPSADFGESCMLTGLCGTAVRSP